MTVEKYNDSLEIDVTASEEKSEEDAFVDHSLKIKNFLNGKAKETKGLSGKKLIKVFKNAGSFNQDISYCVAKINNFINLFLGLQNYKEAVASDFEPSSEDLERAKKECVAFEIDKITFSDVDEFYLEEDEFSKLVHIEI
tara:strand:- start:1810 stop:2229 length:420 start_codon:yes stop_codon:yes gene_type:complete